MPLRGVIYSLAVMNVVILGANLLLTVSVKRISEKETAAAASFRSYADSLRGEQTRNRQAVAELKRVSERLIEALEALDSSPGNVDSPESEARDAKRPLEASGAYPRLSAEQSASLRAKRERMPPLDYGPLLEGAVADLVQSEDWNPSKKRLNQREAAKLEGLVEEFRHFSRVAPLERVRDDMLPLTKAMYEDGAFMEYAAGDPPPIVDGVELSHAEPAEEEGLMRIYYFYEEDYPELYHMKRVEEERAAAAVVGIYELLNGPLETAPPPVSESGPASQ